MGRMIGARVAEKEEGESVFIQKLRTVSEELYRSSDLLHHYATEKDVKLQDVTADWDDINVEFYRVNIRRRLSELKTLVPGMDRKESYGRLIELSKDFGKRGTFLSGTKYRTDRLEETSVLIGETIIYIAFIIEKAEGYEYARESLYYLLIEKMITPLLVYKKPTEEIEKYSGKMDEHIRRKAQIQYLIDDWEGLTEELEFFGMVDLSKASRAYMEFFDATYEDTASIEGVEESRMRELNRLLNKINRTVKRYNERINP